MYFYQFNDKSIKNSPFINFKGSIYFSLKVEDKINPVIYFIISVFIVYDVSMKKNLTFTLRLEIIGQFGPLPDERGFKHQHIFSHIF